MLLGVGRPGLSRGQIEDVRDALESSLWYMRLEGGRYRFTTEPNLNKVVLEREAAIPDSRVTQLVRDAIKAMLPEVREHKAATMRAQPWVHDSPDLPDTVGLTLGALDFDQQINGRESTAGALEAAQRVLEYSGSRFRTNKNAALLVIADAKLLTQARATARTMAALTDIAGDSQRLKRFNAEQKEILSRRLETTKDRLPQVVVMTYRHLALLGETEGKVALDRIDLGPARAGATITERVVEYLRSADRLIDKLAPAALLSPRFSVVPADSDAVELDALVAQFARLTRLPKLASPDVLRTCLADGVKQKVFGLASGSDWTADDAVLRFGDDGVELDEIDFQPGTWLVRAGAINQLIGARPVVASTAPEASDIPLVGLEPAEPAVSPPEAVGSKPDRPANVVGSVRVVIRNVNADKARDVVKVAILPLSANSVSTTFAITIEADGGANGIPKETLDLVVVEGLRQLGLHAEIEVE
jgi:hypothetical protein